MTRNDFSPEYLDQVLRLLRRPQTIINTARQLGISPTLIKRNLQSVGMYEEFANRDARIFREAAPVSKGWDEGMANKRLIMKLRQA